MKNILCVKWGDKYDDYVDKLQEQIARNMSSEYKFWCLIDGKPTKPYELRLPKLWDNLYDPKRNKFWAYRKCHMFNEKMFPQIEGDEFLYLDLDVLIHKSLEPIFELDMKKPWIVRGWWNDIKNCKKNYGKIKSTPLNSSMIRWNRGQLSPVWSHINKNKEFIFFTYSTIDNYFNHFWYDIHDELGENTFLRGFESGLVYSWYKGNIFPDDMETKKLRTDHTLCLFNNSYAVISGKVESMEHMNDIEEIRPIWDMKIGK